MDQLAPDWFSDWFLNVGPESGPGVPRIGLGMRKTQKMEGREEKAEGWRSCTNFVECQACLLSRAPHALFTGGAMDEVSRNSQTMRWSGGGSQAVLYKWTRAVQGDSSYLKSMTE